jgi:hypothetical protein
LCGFEARRRNCRNEKKRGRRGKGTKRKELRRKKASQTDTPKGITKEGE